MTVENQELELTDLETKLLYLFTWVKNLGDPSPVCKVLEIDRIKLDEVVRGLIDKGLIKGPTVN